jgi:hypothetical protein
VTIEFVHPTPAEEAAVTSYAPFDIEGVSIVGDFCL